MGVEHWWNGTDRGNRGIGKETGHGATLPSADLTWTDLGQEIEEREAGVIFTLLNA